MRKKQSETGTIYFEDYRNTLGVEIVYGQQVFHNFTRHTHRTVCFGLVEQGARLYECRGERYQVAPGQVFIIPPDEEHACSTVEGRPHSYQLLLVSAALLQFSGLISDEYRYTFKQLVVSDQHLYNQLRELPWKLKGDESEFIKKSSILTVVGYLFEHYAEDSELKIEMNHYYYDNIKNIQNFIEANYAACFTLEDIAQIAHISPYHLLRLFSRIIGIPPHIYQQQVRIRQSKEMLAKGNTIIDIAMSTGFVDQSHFTKVFKRMVGMTPSEYANKCKAL